MPLWEDYTFGGQKCFGVMYNEAIGRISALIIFFAFNLTFIPQFVIGAQGMPRRYASYVTIDDRWTSLHVTSTIGAFYL